MENYKRNIFEALGVPDNLHETSLKVFDKLLSWTKNLRRTDFKKGEGAKTIIRGNYRIADFEFSNVKIQMGVEVIEQLEEPTLLSMVNRSESQKTEDFRLQTIKRKHVDILIIIGVPSNFKFKSLSDFLINEKREFVENLSHELKHAYDHYKKPYDNTYERAEYQSAISLTTGIPPIDEFIHDIYYTSMSENLVRASEIASAIKNNQISQKEFLKFLGSNDTYQSFKRISNFNYENFKKRLLDKPRLLTSFLKSIGEKEKNLSDEQKLNKVLEAVYTGLANSKIENFSQMLTHSMIEQIIGFEGEKQKVFEEFIKRVRRFRNPDDFFRFYEKRFHEVGREMMRKIAKLYAITSKQNLP